MKWKVDRDNFAMDINMPKLKYSNLGYAVGDSIKFLKEQNGSDDSGGRHTYIYGKGVIEEIYPYFFLVNLGKYKCCVSKVDVWLKKGKGCFE